MTEETCNICREDLSKDRLIHICSQCNGLDSWTCRECLEGWFKSKSTNFSTIAELNCLICGKVSPLWIGYQAMKQRHNYLIRVLETYNMVGEEWLLGSINRIRNPHNCLVDIIIFSYMWKMYSNYTVVWALINDIMFDLYLIWYILIIFRLGYALYPLLLLDNNCINFLKWCCKTVSVIIVVWMINYVMQLELEIIGYKNCNIGPTYIDNLICCKMIVGSLALFGIYIGIYELLICIFDILTCWKISGSTNLIDFKEFWRYVESSN